MPRDDRTEAATPRRRQEARRRGQVARSVEVNSAAILLATLGVLGASGGIVYAGLGGFMRQVLGDTLAHPDLSDQGLHVLAMNALLTIGKAAGPAIATGFVVGLATNLAQVGLVLSLEPLAPRLSRIDPAAGMARIFSGRALAELVKSCAKVFIIGYYGYVTLRQDYPTLVATGATEPGQILATVGNLALRLGFRVGIALAVLAALDYVYQRWEFEKSIRMTKQEVKEELRQTEGDPLLRARIRARQRQIAMHRMMQEVPRADVVVTNPVHLAVALKYDPGTMKAPKVVAKGARLLAQRIRDIAVANNVPIVENKPLAQALYKAVEVGREIPAHLYKAVAEILAYVYYLDKRAGRTGRWR
ncbi:MAG: flagellar biosynthesis protein FlhB [Bacillota bacterium]|nr:flagellar biosynthesis protein FlhB [Bacillota bacterium]